MEHCSHEGLIVSFFLDFFVQVILDLKGLYLLLVRDDYGNFKLAKKGLDMEFCFIYAMPYEYVDVLYTCVISCDF